MRFDFTPEAPPNDVTYANGRLVDRTYASRAFTLNFPPASPDLGHLARYIYKVFDEPENIDELQDADDEVTYEEHVLSTTPAGRKQIKLQITRTAGNVRKLEIQRVPTRADATEMETILKLDREAAGRLMLLAKTLDHIPVEGDEDTSRIDDQLLREIFTDPEAVEVIYNRDRSRIRRFMEDDPTASDVIALARRRAAVEHFRSLLTEPDFFDLQRRPNEGREGVWQRFLEDNSWILGIGLTGQLLTSWSPEKLEQTVAGFSVTGPGKRTDALLRTTGSIRSLVFAEIKHHETSLLAEKPYRPGCWPPSVELAGGITQVQQTVHLASREIGQRLYLRDETGAELGEPSNLLRPRSFLILGNLTQLHNEAGGIHPEKFSSFELSRRNLYEPEILTFDELLARAEWHVTLAEQEQYAERES